MMLYLFFLAQYILGEAPEVRGFYVAAGFNSSGESVGPCVTTHIHSS